MPSARVETVQHAARVVGNYWTGIEPGRVGVMKRIGLALVWSAAIGLMACQGKSPTAPGEGKGTSSHATGASEMRPFDDDDSLSVKLTANPTTIQPGQSATLTWTSTGATSVYLEDQLVAASGSKVVSPSATKTYEIEAKAGLQEVEARATVTVSTTAPPPSGMPTASLTASPTSIQSGQSSMLTWTTSNATQVTLDGAVVAASGSQSVSPTATKTYSLVATNSAGSTTDPATVTVTAPTPTPPPMPTATLNANPASIQSGQSSTLSWSTTDATTITLNGASVAASGSQTLSPTATATYSLVATNSAGSTTATATITVTAPPPPMPTATLNANPASIHSGQSSTLSWATSNATTITLDGAAVAASGSRVGSPTTTTPYTLVASNSTGSVTSTVSVTVMAMRLTYNTDIAPILNGNCIQCHSGPSPSAGRDFTTYNGVMTVVIPFDPNSRII